MLGKLGFALVSVTAVAGSAAKALKITRIVKGAKALQKFKSVESLINTYTFKQLNKANQTLHTVIRGDGEAIFKALTQGGKKLPSGAIKLPDGTKLFKHLSKKTGEFTLNINKAGKLYKIRINP